MMKLPTPKESGLLYEKLKAQTGTATLEEWVQENGFTQIEENLSEKEDDPFAYVEDDKQMNRKLYRFGVTSLITYALLGILALTAAPFGFTLTVIVGLFVYTIWSFWNANHTSKYSLSRTVLYTVGTFNLIALAFIAFWVWASMFSGLLDTLQPITEAFVLFSS